MLTRDNLIIISVASAVGALILLYLGVRFLNRRVAVASNPLPPVQALAHHKEQQLNTAWYPSVGSRASLIPKSQNDSGLTLPSPSFHRHSSTAAARPASSSSFSSNGESPAQSQPPSAFPRSSSLSSQGQPPARKPRPPSVSSSHSTVYSKATPQPHHQIRGTPHGPHSQVQIVMPIPLSADSLAEQRRLSRRKSVVDMWVPGNIHGGAEEIPPIPTPRRAYSATLLTPDQGIAE